MDLGGSFADAGHTVVAFLPRALGAVLLLLVGWFVSRLVRVAVTRLLGRVDLDRRLAAGAGDGTRRGLALVVGEGSAAGRLARLTSWLVLAAFLVAAVGVLDLPAATLALGRVLGYLPHVLVALVLVAAAVLLSAAASAAVRRSLGGTGTGHVLSATVPAVVWVVTLVLVLEQLQVAPEIVRIAFAAVAFGTALALALAFGLGGRDVAARLVEDAERSGRRHADQVRTDLALARERARQAARTIRHPAAPLPAGLVVPAAPVAFPEPTQNLEPLVSSDPGRAYARPDLYAATIEHRWASPPR